MKSSYRLFGIIAFFVVIGFFITGCDDLLGNGENGNTGSIGSSSRNAINLTYNTWHNGNIPESGSGVPREQWFKFTATANTQNIYFRGGDVMSIAFGGLGVQLYDSNLNRIGNRTLVHNNDRISHTTTNGSVYYIEVGPWGGGNGGNFQTGFTDFPAQPGTVFLQLTDNAWMDGFIPTRDSGAPQEQWFKFTATANPQFIHAGFNTLTSLSVQLHDSNFFVVGSASTLNNSTKYISRAVTIGSTYYLKVANISSGTYRIGFNTTTSEPTD
jgi:hypothetical protein